MKHDRQEPTNEDTHSTATYSPEARPRPVFGPISRRHLLAQIGSLGGSIIGTSLGLNLTMAAQGGTRLTERLHPALASPTPPPSPDSLIHSVAGYFTPDGFRHAIAATTTGKLREVFFSSESGKGIARLACFPDIDRIASFFTSDDNFQHQIVSDKSGNIFEVFYKPNDMHFGGFLANFAGIVDIAAFHALDDKNRIVIVATNDGNLHEVFYHPSIGIHISQPPLAQFPGIVAIAAFYTPDDKTRHVIVGTRDGNVTEVFYHPSIGTHISRPPLAHFDGIVDIAAFYAEDDKNRIVIVATADGNLHEVFFNPSIGAHVSQPPLANFAKLSAIAAFFTPDDKFRHVLVASHDGSITEVFYHPSIGVHVSQPPLATFPAPQPVLEDVSPDPQNVDTATAAGLAGTSSCGRVIGIVGGNNALYARTETSGVWKSTNGGPWQSLPRSPSDAALEGPQLAIDPANSSHIVAGSLTGAWESTDGGNTWNRAFDPASQGCNDRKVFSVCFAQDGSLLVGTTCGIARRPPNSPTFAFVPVAGVVMAFAVSQSHVWARTANALLVSVNNGQTWTGPIQVPNSVSFGDRSMFSLAAFGSFAYMPFSVTGTQQPQPCGTCGADVMLLIFDATKNSWLTQNVDFGGCHACDGTGLGGRMFVKSFLLPDRLGIRQSIRLFYGTGQEVYQALGVNADGTISSWSRIAVTFGSGAPPTNLHSDIWDFNVDVGNGGNTAWIGCDGGVSVAKLPGPFNFAGVSWSLQVDGFHSHQSHTLTLLPVSPVHRSRLAYPTSDNQAWCLDTSPIVMPMSKWQAVGAGGDVTYTVGDAANPTFAMLVRHRAAGTLQHFGGQNIGVVLANYQLQRLTNPAKDVTIANVGPDTPTTFQFIQAPKGQGASTPDAVMMTVLPLTRWDSVNGVNVPLAPNTPLAQNSNGLPVLLRNRNFVASPDMNTSKGAGWTVELNSFPAGTQGFYVTGSPKTPVYYAFTAGALFKWDGTKWNPLPVSNLLSSVIFGPAFINPYDQNVLYVITSAGIQISNNAGASFAIDSQLTMLVKGGQNRALNTLSHMAFGYDNPAEVAAVTSTGSLFFKPGAGGWKDLTGFTPRPASPFVAAGIDCEAIYVATDGRSIFRIVDYQAS